MRNKALVVGSVAYDIIFSVHNVFKDEVIVEKDGNIKDISMMLTAQNKKVFWGGTGGNIAYGLAVQKESPYLFSVVGDDFNHDYKAHLENHGVNLKVVTKPGEFTATFYGISDTKKEQIGIFQPNTHGDYMDQIQLKDTLTQNDFDRIKVAVFSPGTGISIRNHMKQLREAVGMDATIIFDPSQVLSIFFDEPLLRECIEMANIFIGNETEIAQLQSMLGMKINEILNLGLDAVIETLGAKGSKIYQRTGEIHVDAKEAKEFVEQTGAGDAFRAGLIKGLLHDLSLEESCKIGAEMAALNVAVEGGQNYRDLVEDDSVN